MALDIQDEIMAEIEQVLSGASRPSKFTAMKRLQHLTTARYELKRQEALVQAEMKERGQLWTNGQCAAWLDYEKALGVLNRLRDLYET